MMVETAEILINSSTVIIKVPLPHSEHEKEASLAHVGVGTPLWDTAGPHGTKGLL